MDDSNICGGVADPALHVHLQQVGRKARPQLSCRYYIFFGMENIKKNTYNIVICCVILCRVLIILTRCHFDSHTRNKDFCKTMTKYLRYNLAIQFGLFQDFMERQKAG